MASLVKRKNGAFHIYYMDDVQVQGQGGGTRTVRKQRAISTGVKDRRLAQEIFREFKKKLELDHAHRRMGLADVPVHTATLEDLWAAYVAGYASGRLKPKTLNSYGRSVNFLADYLDGHTSLSQITRDTMEQFINFRSATSATAANLDIRQLRALFNWGSQRSLCPSGLLGGVQEIRTTKKEPYILGDTETQKIFAAADMVDASHGVSSYRMGLLIRLLYFHGFRLGEVFSLLFKSAHFESGKITVVSVPELGFTVKTYQERAIALYPAVSEMIQKLGPWHDGRLVGYMGRDTRRFREDWQTILRAAGMEGKRFTAAMFRKNFAFRFLQLTRSEQLTRIMMGHSAATDTLIKYYLPRAAMEKKTEIWDEAWIQGFREYY